MNEAQSPEFKTEASPEFLGTRTSEMPDQYRGSYPVRMHEPYVPTPLTVGRIVLTQSELKVGPYMLTRTLTGQLFLTDGVCGTSPDEKLMEKLLHDILENRWHKLFLDNPPPAT